MIKLFHYRITCTTIILLSIVGIFLSFPNNKSVISVFIIIIIFCILEIVRAEYIEDENKCKNLQ